MPPGLVHYQAWVTLRVNEFFLIPGLYHNTSLCLLKGVLIHFHLIVLKETKQIRGRWWEQGKFWNMGLFLGRAGLGEYRCRIPTASKELRGAEKHLKGSRVTVTVLPQQQSSTHWKIIRPWRCSNYHLSLGIFIS